MMIKPRNGERRALQLVDGKTKAVINERLYVSGAQDPEPLRKGLEKFKMQWEASGALGAITLQIVDVVAPRR